MILITTPTGKTGSLITKKLIEIGLPIRVLARHPENLSDIIKSAAEVVQGSLIDQSVLTKTMEGCEAVYYCIPETHTEDDVVGRYVNFATIAANAAVSAGVKRIVFLSGSGKSKAGGGAITVALHKAEDKLTSSGIAVKALRCPVFFESILYQLENIRQSGMLFLPFSGDFKAPQVAVQDIAPEAVKWLGDPSWSGHSGIDLKSDTISYNEIAAVLSDVVAKPIRFINIPPSKYIETMIGIGAAPKFAGALVDMYNEIQNGLFDPEPVTTIVQGDTNFRIWAKKVFLSAYHHQNL